MTPRNRARSAPPEPKAPPGAPGVEAGTGPVRLLLCDDHAVVLTVSIPLPAPVAPEPR
jgi:hypothetical protein